MGNMDIPEEEGELLWSIDDSWSNDYHLGLRGWIVHSKKKLEEVSIVVGDVQVVIDTWHDRPDVVASLPFDANEKCGFLIQIPRKSESHIRFEANHHNGTSSAETTLVGDYPKSSVDYLDVSGLFWEFVQHVNEKKLKVLEIGSRIVGDFSTSKRALFDDGVSYTGFDYYPDGNTDVVGDAHKLSEYLEENSFDAVFSLSVFEHLAMPWVVALEINKILKKDGITFHATHFSWPLHEQPWDFWRFSDEGLKVLFSEPAGFKVEKCGFFNPLRMHLDSAIAGQESLPLETGFGGVAILASKVDGYNSKSLNWNTSIEDVLSDESHYPERE